jgi:hypothetical protein
VIATLVPRFDAMPPVQRRLWPELRPSLDLGFVLYGGTAVSLHLGHRRSIDFDFFHDRPLDKEAIRAGFPFMRRATVLQDAPDTLVVAAPAGRSAGPGIKVSFFGALSFGRVGDPLLTSDGVLELASLDDLMAHKLKVVLQRAERKDYRDLAAMIRAGCSVARGLAAARLFFGRAFQPLESLKAMAYFQDGDLGRLSRRDRDTLAGAAAAVGGLPKLALRSRKLAIPARANGRTPPPASMRRSR